MENINSTGAGEYGVDSGGDVVVEEVKPIPTFPKGRPSKHSPCFSKILIIFSFFESVEERYEDDVVEMELGLAILHRLLSFGEEEGW